MPATFAALLAARSTHLADLIEVSGGTRLLLRGDASGTMQCYELAGDAAMRQLTALPEPVGRAAYVSASIAVVEVDRGGNERHQLYLLDLSAGAPVTSLDELQALTADDRFAHHLAGVAPDGSAVAYVSNRRNGIDFDLWRCDLGSGAHEVLYDGGGWCQPASGFSPDGRRVAVHRPGPRPLDQDLLLLEGDGSLTVVLEHPEEAAYVGAPAWLDPERFLVSSNVGTDTSHLVHVDLAAGRTRLLEGTDDRFDYDVVTSRDGTTAAFIGNVDGASVLLLGPSDALASAKEVALPEPGVVTSSSIAMPRLSGDGTLLYLTVSTPRLAGDVFVYDRDRASLTRLTTSPCEVDEAELVSPETASITSFDGEVVHCFVYRPPATAAPPPVVVYVHGGPEGQSVRAFNPVVQGLVAAGYAVVVPNVRGSVGYGKRFASLDDTTRRLDSVRDLAAVHGWLGSAGLDADRACLWGGSYGGYMVLAGLAFQPELWAAGVDIVGISDLITFLENTSAYRRAHRELEYGSLERDRAFLASASPLRHVEQIRAPLFVIHGRNDPRVPVSEAEQLVASLTERGVRCELSIYEDEGHGLARLANRLDAYPRAVAFLDEVVRGIGG